MSYDIRAGAPTYIFMNQAKIGWNLGNISTNGQGYYSGIELEGAGISSGLHFIIRMKRFGNNDMVEWSVSSSVDQNGGRTPGINNFGAGLAGTFSFTGKHICKVEADRLLNDKNEMYGLLVETTSRYMNFASSKAEYALKPTLDDSVPIVTLSKQDKSKKVFGVISIAFDNIYNPHLRHGFNYEPIYQNENRYEINSIGEGGIWICNKNGPLENGDFITSSTVPGYGMVQDDDLNHNYTVGKITCDCDFSLTKVKQSELVYTLDASDNKILTYDEKGHVQYKDLVDESGNVIYDYPLFTRFVQADGTILEDQTTYESKKAANEEVYIACFVGCVYMWGGWGNRKVSPHPFRSTWGNLKVSPYPFRSTFCYWIG
jgi:hypothetical protein